MFSIQVAARSAQSFSYDNDGNLESDGVRGYEWDSLSRLKKITWATGKTTEFKYNALGQRSERIETDGSSVTRHYYLFDGITPIDRRTGTDPNTASINRRYFQQGEQRHNGASWDNFHYCRDHLGSVREVVNADGTLLARYDFDPYGKRITQYQASAYTGGCDIGFTGHLTVTSPVTGQTEMVLTHFRAHDPELGRWLSADPIGENGGVNLYLYVLGGPIDKIDSFGLWGWRDSLNWFREHLVIGAAGEVASGVGVVVSASKRPLNKNCNKADVFGGVGAGLGVTAQVGAGLQFGPGVSGPTLDMSVGFAIFNASIAIGRDGQWDFTTIAGLGGGAGAAIVFGNTGGGCP